MAILLLNNTDSFFLISNEKITITHALSSKLTSLGELTQCDQLNSSSYLNIPYVTCSDDSDLDTM